jgi:hypothetical protein
MPFTPFHLGPGIAFKAAAGPRMSFAAFAITQVAMDVEPLVHLLRGDSVVHGFVHTVPGATLVALGSAWIARPLGAWALRISEGIVGAALLTRLREPLPLGWPAVLAGTFAGAWSHILFDGLMHRDMRPFAPWSDVNPLLGAVPVGALHLGCVAAGALGIAALALWPARPEGSHGKTV